MKTRKYIIGQLRPAFAAGARARAGEGEGWRKKKQLSWEKISDEL